MRGWRLPASRASCRASSFYIGRETIIPREDVPGMWLWRETVFAFLQRNAERTAAFFDVPARQVVEFGTEIEI